MAPPKVVIIGGGVAGLTAAHELQERGFAVTVYERNQNPHNKWAPVALGGKARSFPVHESRAYAWRREDDTSSIIGLPAEHGFRFFPGFYQHVLDTFRRIALAGIPGKYVIDNLVKIEPAAYAQAGR